MDVCQHLDLEKYPLDQDDSATLKSLIEEGRSQLRTSGVFLLPGFLREDSVRRCAEQLSTIAKQESFVHSREHNIYFDDRYDDVEADHPALTRMHTRSLTICADQIPTSLLVKLYRWQPIIRFIAAVVGKNRLYPMDDPLACLNIKSFREGDETNWHFDRAEFTVTLMIQKPKIGGIFQTRHELRSNTNPNYEAVAKLLQGCDKQVRSFQIEPSTLTIFRGKNTAHRVSAVAGNRMRIVAVLSYFDSPNVRFTDSDRIQFYGRSQPQIT